MWIYVLNFFPPVSFFCMPYMKRLSKCPNSKKPSLPRKVPCCAPESSCLCHANPSTKLHVSVNKNWNMRQISHVNKYIYENKTMQRLRRFNFFHKQKTHSTKCSSSCPLVFCIELLFNNVLSNSLQNTCLGIMFLVKLYKLY